MKQLLMAIALLATLSLAAERAKIYPTADDVAPLMVGQSVPTTAIFNASGKPVSLKKISTKQPLVVVFYRGGWCPYCNHQLAELQGIEKPLADLGYKMVAISPELPDSLAEMQAERNLNYELLSDYRLELAKNFGLAFRVEDRYEKMVKKKTGANLSRFKGETQATLPVPGVFIIGTDGEIKFSYVNPDYSVRLHPELLLTAARVSLKGEDVRLKR